MVKKFTNVSVSGVQTAGTTGGGAADLPKDGFSYLTANETYALEPPVIGCRKTLALTSSTTTAGATVRGSTGTTVTFNKAGATQIAFAAGTTEHQTLELVGLSSVAWGVLSIYPVSSTAAGPTLGTS
jgi:hypothetical protein